MLLLFVVVVVEASSIIRQRRLAYVQEDWWGFASLIQSSDTYSIPLSAYVETPSSMTSTATYFVLHPLNILG